MRERGKIYTRDNHKSVLLFLFVNGFVAFHSVLNDCSCKQKKFGRASLGLAHGVAWVIWTCAQMQAQRGTRQGVYGNVWATVHIAEVIESACLLFVVMVALVLKHVSRITFAEATGAE